MTLQAKGRLAKFHSQKNRKQYERDRAGDNQIASRQLGNSK
jgi:hypothetical protein